MIEEAGGGSRAAKSWRVEGRATFFKKLKAEIGRRHRARPLGGWGT